MPAYFEAVLGEQPELERYQPYSMHQRAAEEFRVGRVLLSLNPWLGQQPRWARFGLALL